MQTTAPHRAADRGLARTVLSHLVQKNRARIRRKVLRRKPVRPWMRPRELELITEILQRLRPARTLEWGSGYSTLYFPGRLDEAAEWLSIEHDQRWAEEVGRASTREDTRIVHVPADRDRWSDEHRDGSAEDLAGYLAYPAGHAPFDLVFIDGRARRHCLQRAPDLLAPGGVVVLHDANRPYYHGPFDLYPHQALFRDHRQHDPGEGGGVWVGSMDRPIDSILDVKRHQRVWRFYCGWGRFLLC